jgi:hypothetical protein
MKKSVTCLLAVLSIVFLSACEKEIDLNIADQPKLVVNALFNPDSLWQIHLSRSIPVISVESPPPVNVASVQLFEDGVLLETFTSGESGFYKSASHKPQVGKTYRLQITHEEFGSIEAIESMEVKKVEIHSAEYIDVKDANFELPVSFTFKDPAGIKNFYVAKVYSVDEKGMVYNTEVRSDELAASSKEVSLNGVGFSDALFDGKEYNFKLKIYLPHPKIIVELQHVSEAYYQYHYMHQAQVSNSNDPFATPTEMFTNIHNGLGIFASYQSDTMMVLPRQ